MSKAVPATRSGNCQCCTSAYPPGTPIVWDRSVTGWVLVGHRSMASR